jgi:hypothetical protein
MDAERERSDSSIGTASESHPAPPHQVDICSDCAQIDFQRVRNLNNDADEWYHRGSVNGVEVFSFIDGPGRLGRNNCALCRVFALALDPNRPLGEVVHLRAYSFFRSIGITRANGKIMMQADFAYLGIHKNMDSAALNERRNARERSYIFCCEPTSRKPTAFRPKLIPRRMDYEKVSEWLHYCKENHGHDCMPGGQPSGLRVIDCDSLSIVTAPPRCTYIALSYVWAKENLVRGDHNMRPEPCQPLFSATQLPALLSATIVDAITVTAKLGIRYLWIDKYCINQDNAIEKARQIREMDTIFKGAELTIVAVAGEDENFGLPGVGSTPKRHQPYAKVGDIQVIASMPLPEILIKSSRWWTRGWTLQESILSGRRLFFTEDQAYFECQSRIHFEAMDINFKMIDFPESWLWAFHSPIHQRSRIGVTLHSYMELISEYTSRDLSFDEDSFAAFAGIANESANSKPPTFQISGIPIKDDWESAETGNITSIKNFFLSALMWEHKSSKYSEGPNARRRPQFPSWSWIGWCGQISPTCSNLELKQPHILIAIEFDTDLVLDLEALAKDLSSLNRCQIRGPAKGLHLKGYVLSLKQNLIFEPFTKRLSSWNLSWNSVRHGIFPKISMSLETDEEAFQFFTSGKWEVVLLAIQDPTDVNFLIFEQHQDFAIRVGSMLINVNLAKSKRNGGSEEGEGGDDKENDGNEKGKLPPWIQSALPPMKMRTIRLL